MIGKKVFWYYVKGDNKYPLKGPTATSEQFRRSTFIFSEPEMNLVTIRDVAYSNLCFESDG